MLESQLILGWMKQGEDRGLVKKARSALLRVIAVRLQDPVPEDLLLTIEGTNDESILEAWLVEAATTATIADLRKTMKRV